MTDEHHDPDSLSESLVAIGAPAPEPEARRPPFSVLIALLVTLLAGALVIGLGESGFMTSDDILAQRTPGLATLTGFFEALSDGDAAAAERFIDPDFAVLQLPDPLGWDFMFPVTFDDRFEPLQSAEGISTHLAVLGVLRPDTEIGNCASETPRTPRGEELYDHFVTCQLRWQDDLRKKLNAPAVVLTIEVGVRDELIRGFFVEAPEDLVDPETATVDPVTGRFIAWLVQQHPAATVDLFVRTQWGDVRGIRGPEAANQLLDYSTDFATSREDLENSGSDRPPSLPPGRIEHALVDGDTAGGVLLIGGRTGYGQGINDVWRFEADQGTWQTVGTLDMGLENVIVTAMRHPATDEVLAVAQNTFTREVALWNLSHDSSTWGPIGLPLADAGWCSDSPGLFPDPDSESVLMVLCNSGVWSYDPTDGSWKPSPASRRAFYDLISPLVGQFYPAGTSRVATAVISNQLFGAGAGQIRSLELPFGPVVAELDSDGPAEVSAMAFDSRANVLIMVGDGVIWSFDLANRELLRRLTVPASGPSTGGMYWRSAAAAYDVESDLVVIFDGERTWTFDHDSGELRSYP